MIPLGDEPNQHVKTPWVNYALIAVNVLVFIALKTNTRGDEAYEEAMSRWGYTPGAPTFETLFTSLFMHASIMHLLGNMWFLYIFGDNVEARLGGIGYLAAYLATGAAATLAFGAGDPDSVRPLVGASGAISGVQGLYFVMFPRNQVKVLFAYWIIMIRMVPARWIILFWFVLQDFLPVMGMRFMGRGEAGDAVAHMAHLGGFASGVVIALILVPFMKGWVPTRPTGPYGSRDPSVANASPTWGEAGFSSRPVKRAWGSSGVDFRADAPEEEVIVGLWHAGRYQEAADRLSKRLAFGKGVRLPEAELIRMAVWMYDGARFDDARHAFEAFLFSFPESRNAPAAHFGLGMIQSRRDNDAKAARAHLTVAFQSHPDAQVRQLASRELARLDSMGS